MPNHVSNNITITGPAETPAALKRDLFSPGKPEYGTDHYGLVFDFNKIIPMPESLHITSGSTTKRSVEWLGYRSDLRLEELKNRSPYFYQTLQKHLTPFVDFPSATVGEVDKLFRQNRQLAQSCHVDIELGEIAANNIALYGHPTWYEWNIANWGCKWNAYHQDIQELSDQLMAFSFDTAWSPPEEVYSTIADRYSDIEMTVRYIDEGCLFAGTYEVSDGILTDYPCPDTDFREFATTHFGWEYEPDDEE